MTDAPNDATNDDWFDNPAPPPRAIEGHPHAAPPRPAATVTDLGRQLAEAPVVARPAPRPAPDDASPPYPADDAPEPPGGRPGRPHGEIWEGCPVRALGVQGDLSWYLDRHSQLRHVDNHTAQKILHLFGNRTELLCRRFPQFDKDRRPRPEKFDAQSASMAMIAACSDRGLFNPDGSVRGIGAWTNDAGELVYHTGQRLIVAGKERDPSEIDGRIYPAYPAIPGPAAVAVRGDPGAELLAQLTTWNWRRGETDAMLALGMTGCQMLGGALDWRPTFWATGDKSTGKSSLQKLLELIHQRRGIVQSTDPTKSGITSQLGHSSLPVALDELEPGDEGSNKERDIVMLARVSSSGGRWLRGSADQKGASGNVYSTFLFSSILIPGVLGPQDRSRLITLSLDPLPADARPPVLTPRTWMARGAALLRVLIDRWDAPGARWSDRLERWREALAEHDLTGRNGDNWATCMAMADMALYADLPSADRLETWARKIAWAAVAETADAGSDAEDMLTHLLGQEYDVFRRGERWIVAQWLMTAAKLPGAPAGLIADGGAVDDIARHEAAKRANEKLAKIGLRVRGEGEAAELFIPHAPLPGLLALFERSRWRGGVWKQAAERIPGATPVTQPLTLAGQRSRGVYVPFRSIGGMLSFPMDRAPAHPGPAPHPDGTEDFA